MSEEMFIETYGFSRADLINGGIDEPKSMKLSRRDRRKMERLKNKKGK